MIPQRIPVLCCGLLLSAVVALMATENAAAFAKDRALDAGFHAMYGLDFASAGMLFVAYENAHPSDPLGYAAESTSLVFSELNRMKLLEAEFETDNKRFLAKSAVPLDSQVRERILALSQRAQQIAEARLRQDAGDEQALFALTLTNGILGEYAGLVERRYWTSIKYGHQGDEFARRLLQRDPQFYDAYIWTGVTNYISGSLPLLLRWPAHLVGISGEKTTGVANLRLAAERGEYLKPYAKVLLSIALLREKNKAAAAALLADLSSEFPTNGLLTAEAKRLQADGK